MTDDNVPEIEVLTIDAVKEWYKDTVDGLEQGIAASMVGGKLPVQSKNFYQTASSFVNKVQSDLYVALDQEPPLQTRVQSTGNEKFESKDKVDDWYDAAIDGLQRSAATLTGLDRWDAEVQQHHVMAISAIAWVKADLYDRVLHESGVAVKSAPEVIGQYLIT